jgi:hypothetical protein
MVRGGHIAHSLYLTTTDSVSVQVSIQDINPVPLTIHSARTFVNIVMM